MTRKGTKSASREWSGPRPTPEAVQTSPYGFRVPLQNASVHANPWSSGECRLDYQTLSLEKLKKSEDPLFPKGGPRQVHAKRAELAGTVAF